MVVFAAGNNGAKNQNYYPACYHKTIAVAATDNSGVAASYTNYGTFVDICAPGNNIYSTMPGDTYASYSGTSFSTPQVIHNAFPQTCKHIFYHLVA